MSEYKVIHLHKHCFQEALGEEVDVEVEGVTRTEEDQIIGGVIEDTQTVEVMVVEGVEATEGTLEVVGAAKRVLVAEIRTDLLVVPDKDRIVVPQKN